MLNLANFPASILDHIIGNRDSSWVIFKLWICGDRLLNEKLSQGLTYVHLTHRYRQSATFPRLLSKLRNLRYLAIISKIELAEKLEAWPLIMPSLSQSLETLELEVPSTLRCLTNYALNSEGTVEPITSHYARGPSRYIDMDRIFPRLHTLTLALGHFILEPIELFAALPSNLTSLKTHIYLNYAVRDANYMAALPRSLLKLKGSLSIQDHPGADWTFAPPNLERIPDFTIAADDLEDYAWLPRSLREGTFSFFEDIPPFSLAIVRSLPPMTHTLIVEEVSIPSLDWLQLVPIHLKRLALCYHRESLSSLSYLPKSLIDLSIQCNQPFDLRSIIPDASAALKFWPPFLQTLIWNADLDPADLDLLPRSILSLYLTLKGDATIHVAQKANAQMLPPHLTALTVFSSGSASFVGEFPSHLELLELKVSRLNGTVIDLLPGSVTTALLSSSNLADYEALPERFPTNLTTLSVRDWPADAFAFLPRILRSLEVYCLDLREDNLETLLRAGELFERLPVSLTSLKIVKHKIKWTEPSLRLGHLVHLKTLHLPYLEFMSSSILRELPSTLADLHLPIPYVEDEHAPFIPYRLTRLQFAIHEYQSERITSNLVQYWPLRALDDLRKFRLAPHLLELLHQRLADPFLTIYSKSQ